VDLEDVSHHICSKGDTKGDICTVDDFLDRPVYFHSASGSHEYFRESGYCGEVSTSDVPKLVLVVL